VSRQPGEPMRKLLALHNEWLVANGYPLHVKKKNKTSQFKAQARHNPHAKLPKSKAQAQAQATRR